jgi:2-hydroxychromene-2-carboxylate isomerase
MRVESLAAGRGVALRWRPFLLGPIFAARGMADSPFNLDAAKGRYMWRDLQRVCAAIGLPLRRPAPFPQNSLLAARVALGLDEARRPDFSRAVYRAQFDAGLPIAEPATMAAILEAMGLDADAALGQAASAAVKDELRRQTALAQEIGLFGAPNLVMADGEIFWGNDRLEAGVDRALALAGG